MRYRVDVDAVICCLLMMLNVMGCGSKTIIPGNAGATPSGDAMLYLPPNDTGENAPDTEGGDADGVPVSEENGFIYECEFGAVESCATVCGTVGERTCGKYWGPCVPPDEICNELDDDCNGLVDDGVTNACGTCGEVPGEVCNGLDDDCNGQVDEGLLNACGTCGEVPVEICDEIDNDCDGQVDEDIPGGCGCNGPTLQGEINVNIPYLWPNCPFGQGDNLGFVSGNFAARVEQNVPFSIPNNITLCSFEIVGGSSQFYFDDHFILTLNNVVLIASFEWTALKNSGNNLFQYHWPDIVGQNPGGDGPSCMAGATQCKMPSTQSNGKVQLEFDKATNEQLVQTGQNGKHVFKVIATGDNDPPKDCHHTGLSLQVKYEYVNP